jgi:tetratricopeptide (TPR) repeat protein
MPRSAILPCLLRRIARSSPQLAGALLIGALALSESTQAQRGKRSGSEEITIVGPRKVPDDYFFGWREYRSEHFVVDSNLLSGIVANLIGKLEKLRAVELASLVAEPVALPGRIRVIAAGASRRFAELARDEYQVGSGPRCQIAGQSCTDLIGCGRDFYSGGYFVSRLREPTIVLPVSGLRANSEVVAHELAHHFASVFFVNPPTWFVEGFAAFVQTIGGFPLENGPRTGTHIQRGERIIRGAVGLAPPGFIAGLCTDWMPAKDVLAWTGEEAPARPGRFHAQSWLLYHWLWNERSKQLARFQGLLASATDPAAAWREAFPEFNPDEPAALRALDDSLDRHRGRPKVAYYRAQADADEGYTIEALSPTDVHMMWLDARYSAQSRRKDVPAWLPPELHELLLEEPLQPMALAWRAEFDQTPALELLRKATDKWPDDWRTWLFRGEAATAAEEKGTAYEMAVKLKPDSAFAQERMALFLATSGSPLEALSFAKQAVSLAPWDGSASATLAVVDAALEQCDEAFAMYQRARRLSVHADLPRQLAEVDRRCGAP